MNAMNQQNRVRTSIELSKQRNHVHRMSCQSCPDRSLKPCRSFRPPCRRERCSFDGDGNRAPLLDLSSTRDSNEFHRSQRIEPGRVSRVPSFNRVAFTALGRSSTTTCRSSPRMHVHRMTFPSLPAEQKRRRSSADGAHHRTCQAQPRCLHA